MAAQSPEQEFEWSSTHTQLFAELDVCGSHSHSQNTTSGC